MPTDDKQPPAQSPAELHIRKWLQIEEEVMATELGVPADGEPLVRLLVAAILRNPYAGRFATDLSAAVRSSESLGLQFGARIAAMRRQRAIQSYGKGCIVGVRGEYEHGNA